MQLYLFLSLFLAMAAHSEGARKSRLRADRSGSLDDSVSSDEETAELFGGRHDHNDDDDSESVKSPSITRDNGKSNKRKGKKDKKNGKNGKNDKDDNDNSDNDDNDDEEDDANPLLDLLPDWLRPCKLLERQFNDNIDCEFQVVVPLLVEREITFSIDYTDEICDPIGGLICVTPGFFGGFDFDDLIVSSGFGFYDISIGEYTLGDLEFNLDICLTEEESPTTPPVPTSPAPTAVASPAPTAAPTPTPANMTRALAEAETEETFGEAALSIPRPCTCEVSFLGFTCNSCEFCGGGEGFNFDCTNIIPFLTTNNQCESMARITSMIGNGDIIQPRVPDFLLRLEYDI